MIFEAKIMEGEIPNMACKKMEYISKMYIECVDRYISLHLKPKPKRMKQETYNRLISKLININYFNK